MIKSMKLIVSIFFTLTVSMCFAQKEAIYSTKAGAIAGYDPVAYFVKEMPVKGMEAFTYTWKGVKWCFSSEKNKKTFESNPEAYAPQYGGYCAYAVSQGYIAKTDPQAWKIVDGKLYLNYNPSVQNKWERDQVAYIKLANDNWPKISDELGSKRE